MNERTSGHRPLNRILSFFYGAGCSILGGNDICLCGFGPENAEEDHDFRGASETGPVLDVLVTIPPSSEPMAHSPG